MMKMKNHCENGQVATCPYGKNDKSEFVTKNKK